MWLIEPHCSVLYQEDLKLENYAISVAHPPPAHRLRLCPLRDVFNVSSVSSLRPSNAFFLLKIPANPPERNPAIQPTLGQPDEPRPLENSWSWFYPLCQLCQAELVSRSCSWRRPPCSDDMEVQELVTVFLSARLSSSRSVLFNKRPGRW